MAIAGVLAKFQNDVAQCDSLISHAHNLDATGQPFFPQIDREQITIAAFLNIFIAWEAFLESSITEFMTGSTTINGSVPIRYVLPLNGESAQKMIVGTMRFFDYANHDYVYKIVMVYFQGGYPFEPHISAIFSDLSDLRTMRNASAHISSSTQTSLESLAVRLFGMPRPGISLYQMLTTVNPKATARETILETYKQKLLVTAELISIG